MIYTRTIWEPPSTDAQSRLVKLKIDEMKAEGIEFGTLVLDRQEDKDVAVRGWHDSDTAAGWCQFVLSVGAASAVIDP